MREDVTEEGRLFLNHLSSMITMSSIDEIYKQGLSKHISVDDLRIKLRKIHADIIEGEWMVKPIKSEVENLCRKLEVDVADLSAFDGILKWKRNPDIAPINSTETESN